MSQSRWTKLAYVIITLASITIIINLIVYKFSSLIVIASRNFSSFVLIADFLSGPDSDNRSDVNEPATNRLWRMFRISQPAPEGSAEPYIFKYVVVPRVNCSGATIVICVAVSRGNSHGRDTIRWTWGSYANDAVNNATVIFFLGSQDPSRNESEVTQRLIDKESDLHGDILQEDYVDHYNNLSLKSVSILRYVSQQCATSQFLLKSDDDIYVNVPLLVQTLKELSAERNQQPFILGHAFHGARPIRSNASKWYTPHSMFNASVYPSYTSGTAYAMTTSAAGLLYRASRQVPVFWLEDVYITGLCARKANVSLSLSFVILECCFNGLIILNIVPRSVKILQEGPGILP
ncbi:Lactosylceramide 1,3-N-acetyl-beta-D-glucosaminyltransferase A [Bulinus truncatus]|nr:Lactosylceramide 1,3-N-acetyl-beta-D-glucosaminyltransferase A [Bulinus truncatus]